MTSDLRAAVENLIWPFRACAMHPALLLLLLLLLLSLVHPLLFKWIIIRLVNETRTYSEIKAKTETRNYKTDAESLVNSTACESKTNRHASLS